MNNRITVAMGLASFLLGLILTSTLSAADFTAWNGVWFKANASESGFQAPLPPEGSPVMRSAKRTGQLFLQVSSCDIATQACSLNVCTFDSDAHTWTRYVDVTLTILSGKPLDFLSFFEFTYRRSTGDVVHLYIPLRIRGTVTKAAPDTIKSGSVASTGGYFNETIDDPPTGVGTGNVVLNGSFIPALRVATKVPPDCLEQD